ncbi:MAG TPA: N-(5'-phosphoribosyl)anthranilate isomerase, partial [Rhodobacteraceae bacterium]|nr:N-(5'-phosphoribosyl)anthranilate isomerase [Paracoccaceae bacterium]
KPWMLAGGLTPENVARAINMTGAQQVDVSSGVEIAPGEKDETLIAAFIKAAKGETA